MTYSVSCKITIELTFEDVCQVGCHRWVVSCFYSLDDIQPIADRVAQHLEIISTNFQFSTRRARILMGFTLGTMLLPSTSLKSHGQNSGSFEKSMKESRNAVPGL